MPVIRLETRIKAPVELCFDLARDIDLHKASMKNSREEAIAGTTSGLIGLNETVTWKARHFGITMRLTSKITEFIYPTFFVDEMVSGPFKNLRHKHTFQSCDDGTIMTDEFQYSSPLGILGRFADSLFLKNYLRRLLTERNSHIKKTAEN